MSQPSLKNIGNIFFSYYRDKFVKTVVHPSLLFPEHTLQPSSSLHRDEDHFLHRITSKLGPTATSTVITRLLILTECISGTENEALWALFGHNNGNIEMRSPPAVAMLTIVVAATIVRFPPMLLSSSSSLVQYPSKAQLKTQFSRNLPCP